MIDRERAIKAAWGLLATTMTAPEVQEVEAKLIDGTWSVLFYKRAAPEHVEAPGCWIILVSPSGQAEWFDAL